LLGFSYVTSKDESYRWPDRGELRQLALFGFLNTTLYLGLYVYAMKYTSAGIGSLAVSTNPLLIVLLSAFWLRRRPLKTDWISITAGMVGIGIATFPLLKNSQTSLLGITVLLMSMVSVSVASVYYTSVRWRVSNLVLNGWQVMLGGIFLLPITIISSDLKNISLDAQFWSSVVWLSLAVSVVGLICWFYLLRIDPVRASLWLFLCPLFGFFFAWWLMNEAITGYTVVGTVLVLLGLFIGQRSRIGIARKR
jgi:drug/metabolite transporter (DMT)-like permease